MEHETICKRLQEMVDAYRMTADLGLRDMPEGTTMLLRATYRNKDTGEDITLCVGTTLVDHDDE